MGLGWERKSEYKGKDFELVMVGLRAMGKY